MTTLLCSRQQLAAAAAVRPSGVMEAPAPWRVLEFYSGIGGMVVPSTLLSTPIRRIPSNLAAARVWRLTAFARRGTRLWRPARGRMWWRPSTSTTSRTTSTSTTSATAPARYAALTPKSHAVWQKQIRTVLWRATGVD